MNLDTPDRRLTCLYRDQWCSAVQAYTFVGLVKLDCMHGVSNNPLSHSRQYNRHGQYGAGKSK